jgi:hypothetical protein
MCLEAPHLDAFMITETKKRFIEETLTCNFGEHCVARFEMLIVVVWCDAVVFSELFWMFTFFTHMDPLIPQWVTFGIHATRHLYHTVTANCEATILFKALTLYIHLLPRVVAFQWLTSSPHIYIITLFRNHITTPDLIHTSFIG